MCAGRSRSGPERIGFWQRAHGAGAPRFRSLPHQRAAENCLCASAMPATPASAFCWCFGLRRWLGRRAGLAISVFRRVCGTAAAASGLHFFGAFHRLGQFVVLHGCLGFQGSPCRRQKVAIITARVAVFSAYPSLGMIVVFLVVVAAVSSSIS